MSLAWPLISSCAAPATGRSFEAPEERVRAAVLRGLRDFPDVREEDGRVVTGWSREFIGAEQGLLLGHDYRFRARHEVRIAGSTVEVRSLVESRAPGGPRSLRWQRVDPRSAEEAFLKSVEMELQSEKKS